MKLADYIHQFGPSPAIMRRRLGVSPSAFRRYLANERIPIPKVLQQIIQITDGLVQLSDFLDPTPPKCATVITLPDGRTRSVLPWCNRDADLDACIGVVRNETREATGPSPPLQTALNELGARVKPMKGSGMYLLDGRPADVRRVIDMANRQRIVRGQEPISYPGVTKEPQS